MKRNPIPKWAVTLFMVLLFLRPVRACVALPDTCQFSNASPVSEAQIVPVTDERAPSEPQPKVWGLIIAFIIAIAVIAYILYQIIKMLDKVIPPPDKKPDPPPNSGNTNYPPVVINPTTGPGPAIAKKYDGKMLAYTNSTGCTITNYDISTFHWPNTWETNSGLIFDHYWSVTLSTSTNLTDWEDSHYQVECFYTSGMGVFYRYLHYGTNFYQCYFRSDFLATNRAATAHFDLTDKPYQPHQFFRLTSN